MTRKKRMGIGSCLLVAAFAASVSFGQTTESLPALLPSDTDVDTDDFLIDAGVTESDGPNGIAGAPNRGNALLPSTPARARSLLMAELQSVTKGIAPASKNIDALFTVPLDDPEAVRRRIAALPSEISEMEGRVAALERQLENREALAPPVEKPSVLEKKPVAPTPPAVSVPAPPVKPTRAEIRAFSRQKSPDPAADPRLMYETALAEYEEAVKVKADADAEYEARQTAFKAAEVEYAAAAEQFEVAKRARGKAIADTVALLEGAILEVRQRIAVARLRHAYLVALAARLAELSEPGLEMFRALGTPRTGIRKRAEAVGGVMSAVAALLERAKVLHRRAAAGALVGFLVQQQEVSSNLSETVHALEQRLNSGRDLRNALLALAEDIESESRRQRAFLLVNVMAPNRQEVMDNAFQARLRESRRASKLSAGSAVTETALVDLQHHVEQLLPKPSSVSTVTDGEKALLSIRAAGDDFEHLLSAIRAGKDRYYQAYRREMVTIYSGLASLEVKARAYSFSYAFIEDVIADVNLLRADLSLWAESRLDGLVGMVDTLRSGEGQLTVLRIGGGIVAILLLVFFRRRIRRSITHTILRLVNLHFFKNRAGLLVRLTVFVLALLPIAMVGLSGYGLFYLVGMQYPEVKISEIVFRWGLFYLVGRQMVIGLTKRERTGRPPLFDISKENFKLLRTTYARLGLFLAVVGAGDEVSRTYFGTGSLNTLVRFAASVWLFVWLLWALFAWRRSLALSAAMLAEKRSLLGRMADISSRRLFGVAFTPLLFSILVATAVFRASRRLLAEGNLLAYIRAKSLRRLSRKQNTSDSIAPALELPSRYVAQFPLYPLQGEEGEVLLPRRAEVDKVLAQIARWRETGQDGSLVLVGEKGIGKTTFLALLAEEIVGIETSRHVFAEKLLSEDALVAEFCRREGLDGRDLKGLAEHFKARGARVMLLDEAHNIFLRTVGGFKAVDALVSLVDATSDKIFWVLTFNSYAWSFLNTVNRHVRAFRKVLRLPSWSLGEIKELIAKRNDRTGITVEFDEVLLDADASSTGGFELISGADGFFRLLWEASRGNPRLATYLWLNALTAVTSTRIRVGLIREENSDFFDDLGTEMRFALAAVTQHENLSFRELSKALNVPMDEAVHAARFLLEYGLLETKHTDMDRYTLAPRFHRQVLRLLRSHHLLFLEER